MKFIPRSLIKNKYEIKLLKYINRKWNPLYGKA